MPRATTKKAPLLSVAQVFNRCQEGVSGHKKYAKLLWEAQEADPQKCWTDFAFCLDHLLVVPEVRRTRGYHQTGCKLSCTAVVSCFQGHHAS